VGTAQAFCLDSWTFPKFSFLSSLQNTGLAFLFLENFFLHLPFLLGLVLFPFSAYWVESKWLGLACAHLLFALSNVEFLILINASSDRGSSHMLLEIVVSVRTDDGVHLLVFGDLPPLGEHGLFLHFHIGPLILRVLNKLERHLIHLIEVFVLHAFHGGEQEETLYHFATLHHWTVSALHWLRHLPLELLNVLDLPLGLLYRYRIRSLSYDGPQVLRKCLQVLINLPQ